MKRLISALIISLFFILPGCKKGETTIYPDKVELSVSSVTVNQASLLVSHNGDAGVNYYVVSLKDNGSGVTDSDLLSAARKELFSGAALLHGKKRIVTLEGLEANASYAAMVVFADDAGTLLSTLPHARADFETGGAFLTLELSGKTKTSLTVKVESKGYDAWCIFTSLDFKTGAQTLIRQALDSEQPPEPHTAATETVELNGLEPGYEYRVIVFPANSSGIYPVHEMKVFRTDWDPVATDEWGIVYKGMVMQEGYDLPCPLFEMQIPEGVILAVCLFRYEKYRSNPSLKYWMEKMIDYSDERFWVEDVTWTTSPPDPVEWVLLAVETAGVSRHLTGRYYMSDPFQVNYDEYPATQGYQKWLGKWEVGDGRISYTLDIREDKKNQTYIASGWENRSDQITLLFDGELGDLKFVTQLVDEHYTFSDGRLGYKYFTAFFYNEEDDQFYDYDYTNELIAVASFTEDDKASIRPVPITMNSGRIDYPHYMQFVIYPVVDDGYIYFYNEADELPHLPMTMTRKSSLDHATNSFHNGSGSLSDAPFAACRRTGKVR